MEFFELMVGSSYHIGKFRLGKAGSQQNPGKTGENFLLINRDLGAMTVDMQMHHEESLKAQIYLSNFSRYQTLKS